MEFLFTKESLVARSVGNRLVYLVALGARLNLIDQESSFGGEPSDSAESGSSLDSPSEPSDIAPSS